MLRSQFRNTQEDSMEKRFIALKQWGSIRDYRQSFEALALPLENLPEAMLEGHFMNGLKPEIRAELRVLRPRCLEQMMDLAQQIKERNLVVRGGLAGLISSRGPANTPTHLSY